MPTKEELEQFRLELVRQVCGDASIEQLKAQRHLPPTDEDVQTVQVEDYLQLPGPFDTCLCLVTTVSEVSAHVLHEPGNSFRVYTFEPDGCTRLSGRDRSITPSSGGNPEFATWEEGLQDLKKHLVWLLRKLGEFAERELERLGG